MQILRLETAAGKGAYAAAWSSYFPCECDPGYTARHPAPRQDSLLGPLWDSLAPAQMEHYFFGFRDEQQMLAWFYSDAMLKACNQAGLSVCVYEAPDDCVLVGHTQIVFIKARARLVERRSVLDYVTSV